MSFIKSFRWRRYGAFRVGFKEFASESGFKGLKSSRRRRNRGASSTGEIFAKRTYTSTRVGEKHEFFFSFSLSSSLSLSLFLSKRITPAVCPELRPRGLYSLLLIGCGPRTTASSSCLPPQVRISHSSRTTYIHAVPAKWRNNSGSLWRLREEAVLRSRHYSRRCTAVNHEKISFASRETGGSI